MMENFGGFQMVLCTFIILQHIGILMFNRKIYKSGYLINTNEPSLLHWNNVENENLSKGYLLLINKESFGINLSKYSNEFYKDLQNLYKIL